MAGVSESGSNPQNDKKASLEARHNLYHSRCLLPAATGVLLDLATLDRHPRTAG